MNFHPDDKSTKLAKKLTSDQNQLCMTCISHRTGFTLLSKHAGIKQLRKTNAVPNRSK